jgi:hypothetical protein
MRGTYSCAYGPTHTQTQTQNDRRVAVVCTTAAVCRCVCVCVEQLEGTHSVQQRQQLLPLLRSVCLPCSPASPGRHTPDQAAAHPRRHPVALSCVACAHNAQQRATGGATSSRSSASSSVSQHTHAVAYTGCCCGCPGRDQQPASMPAAREQRQAGPRSLDTHSTHPKQQLDAPVHPRHAEGVAAARCAKLVKIALQPRTQWHACGCADDASM